MRYLEDTAIQVARDITNGKLNIEHYPKTIIDKAIRYATSLDIVREHIFKKAKAQVMKMTIGLYPAPLKILETVYTGLSKGSVTGYEAEAKNFGHLAVTHECKGLISLFFGQTTCKKNRFGAPKNTVK